MVPPAKFRPGKQPDMVFPDLPDDLTRPRVEQRLLRACKTIRALPDRERKYLYGSLANSMWRQAVEEWEAYAAEEVVVRFVPKPFDVSDCLPALAWCNGLGKSDWRLIWSRSFDVSFRMIAARIGRSDECARQLYRNALDFVWAQAAQAWVAERAAAGSALFDSQKNCGERKI